MGTHGSFIFGACNPYFWALKHSFFVVYGSKDILEVEKNNPAHRCLLKNMWWKQFEWLHRTAWQSQWISVPFRELVEKNAVRQSSNTILMVPKANLFAVRFLMILLTDTAIVTSEEHRHHFLSQIFRVITKANNTISARGLP